MSIPLDAALLYDMESVDVDEREPKVPARDRADAALVAQARTGDYAAFEELVRRYRNDVFALAYYFVRNREDAWDISQEVFIKAHRALGRFRGEASFKTWLLRIVSNQCKDYFKKRRLKTLPFDDVRRIEDVPSRLPGPEEALESSELNAAILTALDSLPPRHHEAFVLREFQGLSYAEMARVMGCKLGTVMSRLHHARKKLQDALIRMKVVEGPTHE